MGRKKVTADNIEAVIAGILNDYEEIVKENVDEVALKVAKKARTALKNGSQQFDTRWGKGSYSSGWKVTKEDVRFMNIYHVHNKNKPVQTHLLERGHALNIGGRAKAYPHIEPVREDVITSFSKEAVDAVRRIK